MAKTQLVTLIEELAVEMLRDMECSFLTVECYLLAIRKVATDPDFESSSEYDGQELTDLIALVKKKDIDISSDDLVEIVKSKQEKEDWELKSIKMWLNLGTKTASDLFLRILEACGDIEKSVPSNKISDSEKDAKEEAKRNADDNANSRTEDVASGAQKDDVEKKSEESVATAKSLVSDAVKLREVLMDSVFGQPYAINSFVSGFFKGELYAETDKKRKGVRSVFTFLGRPGVGKTFLAETAAEAIGRPFKRFDMSGYSSGELSVRQLTGTPKSLVGSGEGELTKFVKENPKCVILFDEIEKAHQEIILTFLQMLDRGMIEDTCTHKNVSFRDAICIFTTNAGKQLYSMTEYGRLSSIPRNILMDALEKDINPATREPFFPQAIVSRLGTGNVIMFDNLPAADLIKVTSKELSRRQQDAYNSFDINFNMDSKLAATVLYGLGGSADARNATARARELFAFQIEEVLRLISAEYGFEAIEKLKEINLSVEYDKAPQEVKKLYENKAETYIVVLASKSVRAKFSIKEMCCKVDVATSYDEYMDLIHKNEPTVALIDYGHKVTDGKDSLNSEDIYSEGRKAFTDTQSDCPDAKIYIIESHRVHFNDEEKMSLYAKGAEGFVSLKDEEPSDIIEDICEKVCQQLAVDTLTLRHQVLSYEILQKISEDGSTVDVELYDLKLTQAIEAEDKKSILSSDEKPNLTWDDIVVGDDVKEELTFFIDYLKNPREFLSKGVMAPKGVLMYGPPGTGKTSIAKVVATLSDVTFLSVSADQFKSKWVGESGENVHKMFATARKYAPAILFIDEIDAIGTKRSDNGGGSEGNHEALNAVLTELDGFKTSVGKPVFVMAATNLVKSNEDAGALDPALIRRFDRQICIDLPGREGRLKILRILAKKNEKTFDVSDKMLESLAQRSVGQSPAKMEGAINTAVRDAVRSGCKVTDEILDESFEKYIYGDGEKWSDEEVLRVCRHEAGHALIARYYGNKPTYITAVARGDHGGYLQHADSEFSHLHSKEEMLQDIRVSLGGRAAETVFYEGDDGLSGGISGDLRSATLKARMMIEYYAMYPDIMFSSTDAMGDPRNPMRSQEEQKIISDMITKIINEQFAITVSIIKKYKDTIDKFVTDLLEKQHMNRDEIESYLNVVDEGR